MEQEFHNCLKLLLVLINDLYSVFAKTNVLAIVAIMVSAFTVYPAFALGTPTSADLFYTTFSGTPNVHKVHASWDGTTFSLGAPTDLASTEGADGIIFAPDGDLLVAGQNLGTINKVHLSPLSITIKSAGSGTPATPQCFHESLDPSKMFVWCGGDYTGGTPFSIGKVPLSPFADGTGNPISGDDPAVDSLAFVGTTAYYTQSFPPGVGDFGTIDLTTFVTHRIIASLPAAHGMIFDSFTGDLILCGATQVTQIIPGANVIISTFTGPVTGPYDQCAADGKGHLYVASNDGTLTFIDYSISHLVGTPDYTTSPFLAASLDDIAPIAGLGGVGGGPSSPVGGQIIPIDMTALFVVGIMTSAFWMIPTAGGIAGAALVLYKVKRKHV